MAAMFEELFKASLGSEPNEWTKDTLSGLGTCKGVLLFVDPAGHPIQLLQAANLRRTAQAKLLEGEPTDGPSRKTDISELTARIYYSCCYNNFQSQITYVRLAHTVFQKKAADWLQLPKPAFAAIDTNAKLPYFYVSTNPQISDQRYVYGLFANRKAAGIFCDSLNMVFGLCRNPSLLGSGNETSCPYLQMKTCPGPCVGRLTIQTYHGFVEEAVEAANGDLDTPLADRKNRMQAAAKAMNYERAKLLKDQIDTLSKLKTRDFDWTTNLSDLSVLHIDTANKVKIAGRRKHVQLYTAWKVTSEKIICLGDYDLSKKDSFENLPAMYQTAQVPVFYTNNQYEHLATLALFLFRSHRQGLWMNVTDGLPETKTLQQAIIDTFQIEQDDSAESNDAS
ncbi:MAG: UvrB/UvrC motif-containing protein [Planctomycetota bacterium]|jgi:hypothetical protein